MDGLKRIKVVLITVRGFAFIPALKRRGLLAAPPRSQCETARRDLQTFLGRNHRPACKVQQDLVYNGCLYTHTGNEQLVLYLERDASPTALAWGSLHGSQSGNKSTSNQYRSLKNSSSSPSPVWSAR